MDRELEYIDLSTGDGPVRRARRRLTARAGAYGLVALAVAAVGVAPQVVSDGAPQESAAEAPAAEIGRGRSPQTEQLPSEAAPEPSDEAPAAPVDDAAEAAPVQQAPVPEAPAGPAPAPVEAPAEPAPVGGGEPALPPVVVEAPASAPAPAPDQPVAAAGDGEEPSSDVQVAAQVIEAPTTTAPAGPTPATVPPAAPQPAVDDDAAAQQARQARREARRAWFRAVLRRFREERHQPLPQEQHLLPPVTVPSQGVTAQADPSPVQEPPPLPVPPPEPRSRFSASGRTPVGVYRGSEPHLVAEYERWLGAEVGWALDFINGESWDTIRDPDHHVNLWDETDYDVVFSLPMLPKRGNATLEAGARGDYDHHWREVARSFKRNGRGDAIVRIGWEFNAKGMPWFAGGKEDTYVRYWRRIVDVMRAEGTDFRFDWTPMALGQKADVEAAYPGDDYVDIIGLDAYDPWAERGEPKERWEILQTHKWGLEWQRDFAAARGKPISFPEWGVTHRDDGKGGGDNPHYIEQMHKWITSNDVAYAMYFEKNAPDGDHQLTTSFPKSREAYRRLFGQ